MKQKYSILKDAKSGNVTIKEYAELDKDMFSLIFEESYDGQKIASAVKEGNSAVVAAIRTPNLYPIGEYAEKIADVVIDLSSAKEPAEEPVELVFNDINLMLKEEKTPDDDESVKIDKLLEDEDSPKND